MYAWQLYELGCAMKNAILLGFAIFFLVFFAGALFGWPYGLMVGCAVLILFIVAQNRR